MKKKLYDGYHFAKESADIYKGVEFPQAEKGIKRWLIE